MKRLAGTDTHPAHQVLDQRQGLEGLPKRGRLGLLFAPLAIGLLVIIIVDIIVIPWRLVAGLLGLQQLASRALAGRAHVLDAPGR